MKLEGTYFDYGMFYPDKDGLWLKADYDGNIFFDGYYYIGNMRDYLPDFIEDDDGTNIYWGEYACRLAYADYQENDSSSFVFYFKDLSKIIKNGKSGQRGLLIVTESDSFTSKEVIQKAIWESERVNRKNNWKKIEPIWEDYITK